MTKKHLRETVPCSVKSSLVCSLPHWCKGMNAKLNTSCHKWDPKVVRLTCSWGALCDWVCNLYLSNVKGKNKLNNQPHSHVLAASSLPSGVQLISTWRSWSNTPLRLTFNLILNKKQLYLWWYHCSKTIWFYAVFCKKQRILFCPSAVEMALLVP